MEHMKITLIEPNNCINSKAEKQFCTSPTSLKNISPLIFNLLILECLFTL